MRSFQAVAWPRIVVSKSALEFAKSPDVESVAESVTSLQLVEYPLDAIQAVWCVCTSFAPQTLPNSSIPY